MKLLRPRFVTSLISGLVLTLGVLPASSASAAPTFSTYVASPSIGWSEGIAVDASGNLFISSYDYGTVFEQPSTGGPLVRVATISGNNIKGLAVDQQGDLFIGAQGSGYLYEESAATIRSGLDATPVNGLVHVASSPSGEIGGLSVDTYGDLLFASGGQVYAVTAGTLATPASLPATTANTRLLAITNSATSIGAAEDVAVAPSGDLLIADNSGRVLDVPSSALSAALAGTPVASSSLRVIANRATSGFVSPIAVKVDASGDVFIGDDYTGLIYEITAGDVAASLSSGTPVASSSMNQVTTITPMGMQLQGLAFGPSGLLYVGDGNNDVIRVSSTSFASPSNITSLSLSSGVNSLTASWSATGSGTSVYRCTLLYGYNSPSSFQELSTTNQCTFNGLSAATNYGVSVVPEFGLGSSAPVVAYTSTKSANRPVVKHHVQAKKRAILCVKGHRRRWIAAVNPRCPAGYTRKG